MNKFFIQSGYDGKEVGALLFNYPKESFSYSSREEWAGQPIVGSVEFVEQYIGQRKPDYYPKFLEPYFYRRIYEDRALPLIQGKPISLFIKPADRHKRFDAKTIILPKRSGQCGWNAEQDTGPYWISEVVKFDDEWRYYVANGQILATHWYQGENEREAPYMDIMFPPDFCGAVDFGVCNGKMTLVENNLPYACGWYGPYSEGKIYGEWLEKGWEYLKTH